METREKNTMRTQTTETQLQENFKTVMVHITQVAAERKLVITAGTEKEVVEHVEYLVPTFAHLTQTGRKKLAKRLYFASTTKNLGRINSFFSYLKNHGVITETIKFGYGEKEMKIKAAKVEVNRARVAYLAALEAYKIEKGDFYKS